MLEQQAMLIHHTSGSSEDGQSEINSWLSDLLMGQLGSKLIR